MYIDKKRCLYFLSVSFVKGNLSRIQLLHRNIFLPFFQAKRLITNEFAAIKVIKLEPGMYVYFLPSCSIQDFNEPCVVCLYLLIYFGFKDMDVLC